MTYSQYAHSVNITHFQNILIFFWIQKFFRGTTEINA